MRLIVYIDDVVRRDDDGLSVDRAFALFLMRLAREVEQLVIVARLDPVPGRTHYSLPPTIGFVGLPHYESLARPGAVAAATRGSLRAFRRALDDADCVWLLGPHPLALAFAALCAIRRRPLVLGVRQDLPQYTRSRHPGRPALQLAARALEAAWRLIARRRPVVVVGPGLADRYRSAAALSELHVSLVRESDIVTTPEPWPPDPQAGLTVLSVGRLDTEKNPLLLADVLALLRERDPRWRLQVFGEGPLAGALASRLQALGVREHAQLAGYLPIDGGLNDAYRSAQVFLHVSWTEGVPQVLYEAFAAGLPVVATDVGGVARAVGPAALLIAPGDAGAAAAAIARLAADPALRRTLQQAGLAAVADHNLDAESQRVAEFLRAAV